MLLRSTSADFDWRPWSGKDSEFPLRNLHGSRDLCWNEPCLGRLASHLLGNENDVNLCLGGSAMSSYVHMYTNVITVDTADIDCSGALVIHQLCGLHHCATLLKLL